MCECICVLCLFVEFYTKKSSPVCLFGIITHMKHTPATKRLVLNIYLDSTNTKDMKYYNTHTIYTHMFRLISFDLRDFANFHLSFVGEVLSVEAKVERSCVGCRSQISLCVSVCVCVYICARARNRERKKEISL